MTQISSQHHAAQPAQWLKPQNAAAETALPESQALPENTASSDQLELKTTSAGAVPEVCFIKPKRLAFDVYTTYATPTEVKIRGRLLEDDTKPSCPDDNWLDNLQRAWNQIESDEIPGQPVEITFNGQRYGVMTDREGFFELRLRPEPALKPGKHALEVTLGATSNYQAETGQGQVIVHDHHSSELGVVSDIDDTILQSHVTSKLQFLKGLLFKNALDLKQVPGMATLYHALERQDGQLDGDIHYLSGSPVNLNERLDEFQMFNGFPEGSRDLKHMGLGPNTDKLLAQKDYKLNKLRELFTSFPERRFLLIGDSGEKDPEIYRQIQKEFPQQVKGILIRNVSKDQATDQRYQGQLLFNQASEAAAFAQKQGWITQADVERVKRTQQREQESLNKK